MHKKNLKKIPVAPIIEKPRHPFAWLFKRVRAARNTMLDNDRLTAVADSITLLLKENVPGAVVECGTYRGGNLAVMTAVTNKQRPIWGFDSFSGLPVPDQILDGEKVKNKGGTLKASIEEVEKVFESLEIGMENVTLVAGLFDDSLPTKRTEIGPIAFLYIDADLYSSTKTCLENFYDQVSVGGIVACDDYYSEWIGARKAVDEFLISRGLSLKLTKVGKDAAFWTKSSS